VTKYKLYKGYINSYAYKNYISKKMYEMSKKKNMEMDKIMAVTLDG
jgi:hypothetical protein